jgi:hypothetical protein
MLSIKYSHHLQFLRNLQPTVAFESYWRFAAERHGIYLKRLKGEPPPWTADRILQASKFTNSFRVLDRVSQYLLKEVIYKPELPTTIQEVTFRVLLFKMFNSIPAWEVLVQTFGTPTWAEFDQAAYAKALGDAWNGGKGKGVEIWNLAYVQNQNYRTDLPTKHQRYLALVEEMMDDRIDERLQGPQTYEQAFNILRHYPLHRQRFLPMQHLTDLNYSPVIDFDENDFVVAGDGAVRGIRKCFGLPSVSVQEAQSIIYQFVDEQEVYFKELGHEPVTLFGRRLHAIDVQNVFCETDKYARVAHPQLKLNKDDVERIKQAFEPVDDGSLPLPFLPPKWNINA